MISQKIATNLYKFEKSISRAIFFFLGIAFLITTALFIIIYHQNKNQQDIIKIKAIDTAINMFQFNLSEKLSIIANSNIFIDFLTSGNTTRKELEPLFLTELLPLSSDGVIGYSLKYYEGESKYNSGINSNQSVTLKLCYLANKLDSKNGNCIGSLKLFFSEKKIINNLLQANSGIKYCISCNKYNLAKDLYLGNFPIDTQKEFFAHITEESQHENIFYFYIIIVFILLGFSRIHKIKLRKIINKTISNPLDALVNSIKMRTKIPINNEAIEEISYLSCQIQADRDQINKINGMKKNQLLDC